MWRKEGGWGKRERWEHEGKNKNETKGVKGEGGQG